MERMRVRPAPGRTVFDPRAHVELPQDGADVPRSSFWLRRLRDGDVVRAETNKRTDLPKRTRPAAS